MLAHKIKRVGNTTLALAVIVLAGCSTDIPTNMTEHKVRVHTEPYVVETKAGNLDQEGIYALAQDFASFGSGKPEITVAYDPYSKTNTPMTARKELARVVKAFSTAGVKDVDAALLPVNDIGDEAFVQVAYSRSYAEAPKDCKFMPGLYDGTEPSAVKDYKFGCSVDSLVAKQIARPRDLLGNEGYAGAKDGMRNANIVWPYKSGEPLGQLQGESTQ